jgi:trehalose 6-phosphate phosphatase
LENKLEYLFTAWSKVLEQLHKAKHILLLTDYDGTLTPIVEKPELAELSRDAQRILQSLVYQRRFTVGIISGRALADLKSRTNIDGAIYAGNHGFEIEGPGLSFINPLADEMRPFFRLISQMFALALEATRGVFIENKGLTLSVHYRQMPEKKEGHLKRVFDEVVKKAREFGNFKVTRGKKVYELRPAVNWNKGKAIDLLIKRYGKKGMSDDLLPVYLGDDITDEDGFQIIKKYRAGITVHVGVDLKNTQADYFLKTPVEVTEFLKKLLEHSRRGFK